MPATAPATENEKRNTQVSTPAATMRDRTDSTQNEAANKNRMWQSCRTMETRHNMSTVRSQEEESAVCSLVTLVGCRFALICNRSATDGAQDETERRSAEQQHGGGCDVARTLTRCGTRKLYRNQQDAVTSNHERRACEKQRM